MDEPIEELPLRQVACSNVDCMNLQIPIDVLDDGTQVICGACSETIAQRDMPIQDPLPFPEEP